MTRDEAVSLLKYRLKRSADTSLDALIVTEMKFVQTVLEGGTTLPWFLANLSGSGTTTASDERLSLPTGFLREIEEAPFQVLLTSGEYRILDKDDYGAINARWPTETGRPQKYASIEETYIRLRPVPDAVYTIRMPAYIADTVLSSNIENKWLKYAPDLFIAEVGARIAGLYLRDTTDQQVFLGEAAVARKRLMDFNTARESANREYGSD